MPVLASTRKVPGTPWYLSLKVDCEEIYEPLHRYAWLMLGLTAIMTMLVGIITELFWERKRLVLAERIESLMNHANDIILLHDEQLHILEANHRALETYGYSLAELQAMPTAIGLRAPAQRMNYHQQIDPLFQSEHAIYESVHQRKNGTTLPVEISSRVMGVSGKRYVFTIIRDLTERKAQEQKILQLSRYYNTLNQVSQSIIRVHSRTELLREACQLIAEHGEFKAVLIGFLNRETNAVVPAATAGESQEIFERVRIYADDRPEGQGTIGNCIRTEQPAVVNDIAGESNLSPWHDYAATYGLCAVASVPIRLQGTVVGVLSAFAGTVNVFHAEAVNLLAKIAADISYALDGLEIEAKRQQAENELFIKRQNEQAAFDALPIGYAHLRLIYVAGQVQDAVGIAVNAVFERLTGWTNVVGKKLSEVVPGFSENGPAFLARFATVAKTGTPEQCVEFLPQLNRWFSGSISCLMEGEVIIFFDDITERKSTEIALYENHKLFRTLLDLIPDEIFFKDNTGKYLFCNTAHWKDVGHASESKITGKTIFDIVPSGVAQRFHDDDMRVIHAGEPIVNRVDYWTGWRGDQSRWRTVTKIPLRSQTGAVTGMVGVIRDITKSRQLQEDLQLRVNALQAAANAVVLTDATGRIAWVNVAFTRLTGYTEAEALGQTMRLLKSDRHDATFYRQLWDTICAGQIWHGEIFNRRKDGREYVEEMTITPVTNEQGAVTHFIAIKQDVTARHQNAQELADANQQLTVALAQLREAQTHLVSQERLRALGGMANNIAHDFNNALTPILGLVELLLRYPDLTTDRDKLARYIRQI
ncbi:MAG: PAS domain S-box protein, partial [Verrucomicrobiota bacterium]